MPLITRNSQNANVKLGTTAQLSALTFTDGDLASDTTLNKVKVFNGTSLSEIGATSFSASAVVSQSTTIANYTTPNAAVATSPTSATVEYLVIGGGGGGSIGGGGAGAYRTDSGFAVSAQTYAITVGAGGAGSSSAATNGSNSVFSTITSTGGGGGNSNGNNGLSGGSGGGSGGSSSLTLSGGSGTTGGNNGGGNGGFVSPPFAAGGGGGAGAVGGSATSASVDGAGGAGLSSSITGSSVCRAGGGSGGGKSSGTTAATCGGGTGGNESGGAVAGAANTGGGGGGAEGGTFGAAGGSGIVIIKYLTSDISATGGTITTDGSYTIHSFTSSGSFVVSLIRQSNNAIDDNTATKWTSNSESNPNIYVDMGSALNLCGTAFYFDSTGTTNTEILIQSSPDASVWTTRRTITETNLTDGAYNFYRFNIAGGARYIRFYGNSAGSTVLSIWEIKVLKKTDAEIFNDLGILTITASDTTLGPDGT